MNYKLGILTVSVILAIVIAVLLSGAFIGKNNVQNFQVIQSPTGTIKIQSQGGFYLKCFDTVWTYPKVNPVFFSNQEKESKDQDGVQVVFSNKGKGDISSQVVYRIFTDNVKMLKMHEYAHGNLEVVDNLVLSKLKDISMTHASNITSSLN